MENTDAQCVIVHDDEWCSPSPEASQIIREYSQFHFDNCDAFKTQLNPQDFEIEEMGNNSDIPLSTDTLAGMPQISPNQPVHVSGLEYMDVQKPVDLMRKIITFYGKQELSQFPSALKNLADPSPAKSEHDDPNLGAKHVNKAKPHRKREELIEQIYQRAIQINDLTAELVGGPHSDILAETSDTNSQPNVDDCITLVKQILDALDRTGGKGGLKMVHAESVDKQTLGGEVSPDELKRLVDSRNRFLMSMWQRAETQLAEARRNPYRLIWRKIWCDGGHKAYMLFGHKYNSMKFH
ncbi:hypothetical protein DXG01_007514 [Tephrocybe rancida]|nr:hypothetical protein DXG01_007514 [Tephrocybe rancida]